jgi:hypothetical protein
MKTLDAVLVINTITAVCDVSLVVRLYGIQHVHFADYDTDLLFSTSVFYQCHINLHFDIFVYFTQDHSLAI